ncbi:uncharacterized protein G2W53_015353 [Senna tora]|uniref:Uncharacterized protein n=1 Tax=Senna tora TaxID=362788 RepID=A0A834WVF2_9FABA|nr:uncharacterized protein G2W53_015353 [Senna tora]
MEGWSVVAMEYWREGSMKKVGLGYGGLGCGVDATAGGVVSARLWRGNLCLIRRTGSDSRSSSLITRLVLTMRRRSSLCRSIFPRYDRGPSPATSDPHKTRVKDDLSKDL